MNIKDINVNKVIRLARKASSGDTEALKTLQEINYRIADNANRRFKTFERNQVYSPSYNITKNRLGERKTFSKSKKLTPLEYRDQILNGLKFLNAETGTVKGYREYRKKQLQNLKDNLGIEIDPDRIEEWEEFLRSELFNEFKEFDSERALLEGADAINRGLSIKEVNEKWERYKKENEYTLDTAWIDVTESVFGDKNDL